MFVCLKKHFSEWFHIVGVREGEKKKNTGAFEYLIERFKRSKSKSFQTFFTLTGISIEGKQSISWEIM